MHVSTKSHRVKFKVALASRLRFGPFDTLLESHRRAKQNSAALLGKIFYAALPVEAFPAFAKWDPPRPHARKRGCARMIARARVCIMALVRQLRTEWPQVRQCATLRV
jgi:hypothetical protein